MDAQGRGRNSMVESCDEDLDLRRGPWTVEDDIALVNYIADHGDGRWNSLARCAVLKRTGKSCRLRWLYLRPDARRGNITLEEQLLILQLHSRWGNRWSKIAQHLPGRTDNEIKNYWRTRVQKHAKQLKCDVNSKKFKDTMRYLWMPRLVERIQSAATKSSDAPAMGGGSAIPADFYYVPVDNNRIGDDFGGGRLAEGHPESSFTSPPMDGFNQDHGQWMTDGNDSMADGFWNVDDVWFL